MIKKFESFTNKELYKLRISSSIKSIGTFDYIKGIKTE